MKITKKKQLSKKIKPSKMTLDRLATIIKGELDKKATKDDLKNFATKEDLKNFATKEDLKNFATKEDLHNLKSELKEELLGGIDNLLTRADKVLSKFDRFNQEETVHTQSHKRIDEALDLHDGRIKKLEIAKA